MELELLTAFFKWSSIINFGFLLYMAAVMMLFPGFIYQMHTRFFRLSRESFDTIIYCFIGLYKICFFFFNLIPYVVLRMIA